METRPPHDKADAVAPPDADVFMPVMNSTDVSQIGHGNGVTGPHQGQQPRDGIYQGGPTPGGQLLLAENQNTPNPTSLDYLLNPPSNNTVSNDPLDEMHAAETESVSSDLSTGAYRSSLTEDLNNALDLIRSTGSFATFSPVQFKEQPVISVEGVGEIKVPLQEDQARQLINKARKAPFGKGSHTVVDTSVRNTWELDASQVQFRDPEAWNHSLGVLCKIVAERMGINSPVSAELYKMLIYEKGAMFKAHTDTEKIPGMFGTMIICLPSPHEGGDLIVKHRGKRMVFKTSEEKTGRSSLACWYSDVSHEVLPVTSGYRWVLTYNLAIPPNLERPTADLSRALTKDLRHTLRRWVQEAAGPDFDPETQHGRLWYELEHEYTEANLRLSALKGTDLLRVQCLKELATELGMELFLAVIKKEEEGVTEEYWWMRDKRRGRWDDDDSDDASYHSFDEVLESSMHIPKLVDLNGNQLAASGGFSPGALDGIEEDWVKDSEPFDNPTSSGEEGYSGYMGNSAPTATHWYCQTVLLMFPNQQLADQFFVKHVVQPGAQSLLPRYLAKCRDPKTREQSIRTLHAIAKRAWAPSNKYHHYDYEIVPNNLDPRYPTQVLKLAIDLGEYGLFNDVVGWLGANVKSLVYTHVKQCILDSGNYAGFASIKDILLQNILLNRIADRYSLVKSLTVDVNNPCFGEVQQLALEVVTRSIEECRSTEPGPGEADGLSAVWMIRDYHDDVMFQTTFVPILKSQIHLTSFVFGALEGYLENPEDDQQPRALPDASRQIIEDIAKSALTAMDFRKMLSTETYKSAAGKQKITAAWYRKASLARRPLPVVLESYHLHSAMLETFVENCLRYGFESILLQFCFKVVAEAEKIPKTEFRPLWIPFLGSFINILQSRGLDLTLPRYQQLGCAILDAYLDKCLGKQPTKETDYSRPAARVSCGCADCRMLNAFLVSPDRTTLRVPASKSRRLHLHRVLDSGAPHCCSHETDRSTRPETLVITKYSKPTDKPRQDWEERAQAIITEIRKFDQEGLRKILGTETYSRFTDIVHLASFSSASQNDPAKPAAVAGTKRNMPADAEAGWNTRPL